VTKGFAISALGKCAEDVFPAFWKEKRNKLKSKSQPINK
jgi:hypothetical protein